MNLRAFYHLRAWPIAAILSASFFNGAQADPPVRKVTVVGTAIIKVVPDEMNWTVQVSVNDATLAAAKARHDASLDAALKYIKGLGDAVKDLQTGGITFDKATYFGDDEDLKKHPFSCATQLTFTLTDFNKYGAIADALAKLDGLQVQSVGYSSSKERETRREALKQALVVAHDKANDLAVTANCYIDKPLEIIEQDAQGWQPMYAANSMRAAPGAAASTPGAVAGQLEISASVTATYDLFYK